MIPICTAPVSGGCPRECGRTPTGFRRLCESHKAYKRDGVPLTTPAGSRPRGRKTVRTEFEITCPTCLIVRKVKQPLPDATMICRGCAISVAKTGQPSTLQKVLSADDILAYQEGASALAIATRIGWTARTVIHALKRSGVEPRNMSNAVKLLDHSKMQDAASLLRASGEMSILQSAGLQGISVSEWTDFSHDKWERIRSTKEWSEWRTLLFSRDDYRCRFCGDASGPFDPHHIRPKAEYPELMFDVDNGITLCRPCHQTTFGKEAEFIERCTVAIS